MAANVVYCSYANRAGHALVGARPYLPREWASDPGRCTRTYPALPHHLVLALAALAVAAVTAIHACTCTPATSSPAPAPTTPDAAPPADTGLNPLTVAEAKRLINLFTRTRHSIAHHLRWHIWR